MYRFCTHVKHRTLGVVIYKEVGRWADDEKIMFSFLDHIIKALSFFFFIIITKVERKIRRQTEEGTKVDNYLDDNIEWTTCLMCSTIFGGIPWMQQWCHWSLANRI